MSGTTEEFVHDNVTYLRCTYEVVTEKSDFSRDFSEEEKLWCRPIAETLAMLDGNAFFGMVTGTDKEMWEYYLPEACSIFYANGGITGWATKTSWMKNCFYHETPEVEEAYNQWRTLKALSRG